MPRPPTYDANTRDALLRAAGRILAEEGAAPLTMRRLAAAVDATTSAIYALFGSKEGVLRAMYREGFEGLARHLGAVTIDDPIGRIRALAYAYRQSAIERPHLYQVMFACPVPDFVPGGEDLALGRSTLMTLHDAVLAAVRAGALRGDIRGDAQGDVEILTVGLWATVHGLASLELGGSLTGPPSTETVSADTVSADSVSADSVWAVTVDAVLAGMSA